MSTQLQSVPKIEVCSSRDMSWRKFRLPQGSRLSVDQQEALLVKLESDPKRRISRVILDGDKVKVQLKDLNLWTANPRTVEFILKQFEEILTVE